MRFNEIQAFEETKTIGGMNMVLQSKIIQLDNMDANRLLQKVSRKHSYAAFGRIIFWDNHP